MDAYLLQLEGQGDIELKLVDKETYDWITSDNMGRLPDADQYGWIDQTVPASVKQRIFDIDEDDLYESVDAVEVHLTSGSWENDRAMYAPACFFDGEQGYCFTVSELMDFCKKHDINIVETYEGCIY